VGWELWLVGAVCSRLEVTACAGETSVAVPNSPLQPAIANSIIAAAISIIVNARIACSCCLLPLGFQLSAFSFQLSVPPSSSLASLAPVACCLWAFSFQLSVFSFPFRPLWLRRLR
jgi:hypothetical protein